MILIELIEPKEYVSWQPTQNCGNLCLRNSYPLPSKQVIAYCTVNGYQLSVTLGCLRSYTVLKNMDESNTNIMV